MASKVTVNNEKSLNFLNGTVQDVIANGVLDAGRSLSPEFPANQDVRRAGFRRPFALGGLLVSTQTLRI